MDPPELRVQKASPTEPSGPNSKDDTIAVTKPPAETASRKTLHQNIFGKLRPLPFQYHWTFWYDKYNHNQVDSKNSTSVSTSAEDYDNRLYVLYEDVADIATFYRVYNNYPWEKIPQRDTMHIFRKGVKPVWEDPENRKGGSWRFRVPKRKAQAFFHEIAILCLANEFQAVLEKEHDHVLGVSTSIRFNTHLISVWHKLGTNERSIKLLEQTILNRLSPNLRPTDPGPNSYFYKRHDENDGYKEAVERYEGSK
ncbi:translation initiation factor eIF 4e-like domain-containing protein [Aspergillus californicus]